MKKLITRAITGIVLVLVMLTSILFSEYSFAALFLLILFASLREFNNFFKQTEIKPNVYLSVLVSTILFGTSFFIASGTTDPKVAFGIFPLFFVIMATELYHKKTKPVENIAVTLFGILYVAFPLSLTNFLVFPGIFEKQAYTPSMLIALFCLIWIYDSGAYLVGVSIGKHRLFERISPKKSWEGAIGGTLFAIGASYAISGFIPEIKFIHWAAISLIVVISGTYGDLTESMFKRFFGIKDSGNILPGHGGLLDRFDSLFFVVPAVLAYIKIFVG